MKLSEKQRLYLIEAYDDAVFKQLHSKTMYVCNKCAKSNHGKSKYLLFNTKENKVIKKPDGIFTDLIIYEKYLEAVHFWKNDYVLGESNVGLLYCPSYPEDLMPNPFNIVSPNRPWTLRKNPRYPIDELLNKSMILAENNKEELDKLLAKHNKDKENKTKLVQVQQKPISIYSENISQKQRIALIRRYRILEKKAAFDWVHKNIHNLKLICLNCS
jgi:hypothetical protein